jgi:hypothetical protein
VSVGGSVELAGRVLSQAEDFWVSPAASKDSRDLLRYSFLLGILPFAGFLVSYTVIGRIWSIWPWIQTTLPVTRGLMCAGLQWIFFSTFPVISSLLLELLFGRAGQRLEFQASAFVITYSMTPLFVVALFAGVPYLSDSAVFLGFCAFLYLLYTGYRAFAGLSVFRSILVIFLVSSLFAVIRQMFVYVIGF